MFDPKEWNSLSMTETVEIIDKDCSWGAQGCHGYMMYNRGNTNCTVMRTKILRPGEWFSSGMNDPRVAIDTVWNIEFDRVSAIYDNALLPGRDPSLPNDPYDPNNPQAPDNRLEITRSFLSPRGGPRLEN